jgi:hypothetical protein
MEPAFIAKYEDDKDVIESQQLIDEFMTGVESTLKKYPNNAYVVECLGSKRVALRYLVARKKDVKNAVTFFQESVEKREEIKLDELFIKPIPEIEKIKMQFPHSWHGYAKDGRPVYVEWMGNVDVSLIEKDIASKEGLIKYHSAKQEFSRRKILAEASIRANRRIDKCIAIIDLKNLGAKNCSKRAYAFFTAIAKTDQTLYPETLHSIYVVNAGWWFSVGWSAVSVVLDQGTRDKFKIFAGVPTKELSEIIDLEELPTFLGGKCKCAQKYASYWDDVPDYKMSKKPYAKMSEEEKVQSCYFLTPPLAHFIQLGRLGEEGYDKWKSERDEAKLQSTVRSREELDAEDAKLVVGTKSRLSISSSPSLLTPTSSPSKNESDSKESSSSSSATEPDSPISASTFSISLSSSATSANDTPQVQQPPSANKNECFVCNATFGVFLRRHHCRNCGHSVCAKHSERQIALLHFNQSVPQRVCEECYQAVLNHEY